MIGTKIGRFLILEQVGRGGMGTVWKARDELLGRMVAVKVLDKTLPDARGARSGFRREAEIAARLEHPSIVPVYDAGEFEGSAYLVMKLIEGETLARFVERRLPQPADVLRVAASATDALGYAHSRGVIHRDITPRNIMLTDGDGVYVLDFGLARIAGASASSSGHIVGTPAYLAPETVRGLATDARSDIYGLGVVMYEALTGTLPFAGERPEVFCYNILNSTVEPPSRLRPELGPDLDALVMRMLSRDPAGRPASAQELGAELSHLRSPSGLIGEQRAPRRRGARGVAPAGPATSSTAGSDGAPPALDGGFAERVSSRRANPYLAVLPIETPGVDDADPERRQLLRGLAEAARAGLSAIERLHILASEIGPDADEEPKRFARRVGANLLLRCTARFSGMTVRIVFALLDPERAVRIGGGSVDGSLTQPFELEDRLVGAVREALGFPASADAEGWRARPRDPAAQERFAQAMAYLRRFDHEPSIDSAIKQLEGLLTTEGESAAVHAALTRAYLHRYRQSKERIWESRAAQACERAQKLAPHAPEVMLAVGELLDCAGRHAEALVEFDHALAVKPDFYEGHLAKARALEGARRISEAEASCRRAISLRPGDWRGYHILGLVLFNHGRYPEAEGPWRKVMELTPDNASAHRNLGSALYQLERYDEALSALRQSNEIKPNAMAFYNLGTVLFNLDRYGECVDAFEKAVALTPADPWTWGNLGNACRRIPGQEKRMRHALETAIALMKERLDRGPGEGEDWARLAGWLANLERRDEAERAIRRALELSPENVLCMVEAGLTMLRIGTRAEAIEWLRRAVRSGYSIDRLRRSPDLRALAEDAEFQSILEEGSRTRGAGVVSEVHQGRPS